MRPLRPALALCALLLWACTAAQPDLSSSRARHAKPLTFSILEDYDKGDDFAEVAADFDLFDELEIRTWRGSFGWDDYEPEAGRYDLAWLHEFISLAERRGIVLRPYLGYTPEWAAGGTDKDGQAWNQPPRSQDAWGRFVTAIAQELKHHHNVPSLEIYNEQNVPMWWEGSRADYAATLRTAVSAARRARRFDILAGGLVFADLDWVEDVCASARDFDILPVHAYPETWTPAEVTVENYLGQSFGVSFAGGVDQACGRKRIWINETGFATTPGRSERDQAAWWVRAIATFAGEPRVEHIGVYEIKDLRPDRPAIGDAPNYHLGLTRTDRSRKLAFATVDLLTDLLDTGTVTLMPDAVSVERLTPAGELHHRVCSRVPTETACSSSGTAPRRAVCASA